jgi:hypothetical protein
MTTLIHTIALHIGAQGSGHGKSEVITFVSNRTQAQVIANHSMASRMYSLKLNHQCSEYEDSNLTKQFYTNLMAAFQVKPEFLVDYVETVDDDGFWVSAEQFATIYMQIANLVDADMQWADSNPTTKPHHIGGYGLFF